MCLCTSYDTRLYLVIVIRYLTLAICNSGIRMGGPEEVTDSAEDRPFHQRQKGHPSCSRNFRFHVRAGQEREGQNHYTKDTLASEKIQKTTEEPPSRVQSSSDDSVQAIVGTAVPEDCPLIETSAEGKLPFISRIEWIEATKPLQHLVRICDTRSILYEILCLLFSMLTVFLQVAQATERATKELGWELEEAKRATEGLNQEFERTKSEFRLKEGQAQKVAKEAQAELCKAQAKLTVLEEEVGKLRETSQWDLAKAVVQKVLDPRPLRILQVN